MKKLFLITLVSISAIWSSGQTKYYVSETGSNSNAGTSTGAPWQTVSKVVSSLASINANDSVLFNRDDNFDVSAAILLTKSGIKFGAYGNGARPKLNALTVVTGWTLVSTGLYKASLIAPADLRYVTIDDMPVEWGRTPNKGQGLSSYYYSTSYSNGSPKTITLSSALTDRVGHRFAMRGDVWGVMGIAKCTAQVDKTLTYTVGVESILGINPAFRYPSRSGTGICFVGNIVDCDTYGEWAYDSTAQELYMYFGSTVPSTKIVKASMVDKIFDCAGNYNISIENLELVGANKAAIYGKNGAANGSLTFRNLTITGSGYAGIIFSNQQNITIEDCSTVNVYSKSFRINSAAVRNGASIQRNTIVDNGPHETMCYGGDFSEDGSGIVCGANDATIMHNNLNRIAYHGIWFTGSDLVCDTNYINRFGTWTNDCGGLYTFARNSYEDITIYTNRVARKNIIVSGRAWVYGYQRPVAAEARAIYVDARGHNVDFIDNLVYDCDMAAANNSPIGITHRGNTYIAHRGINFRRLKIGNSTDFEIKANIISLDNNTATMFAYFTDSLGSQTIAQDFAGDVSIDSNICNSSTTAYNAATSLPLTPSTNYSLSGWRTLTGVSANDVIVPYLPISDVGRKLVYNVTGATDTIPLYYKYRNYLGVPFHNGSIVLQDHTWELLVYDGPLDGNTQPPIPTNPGDPVWVPWRIN